ncbi:MAG TPA: rhamnogalacturonan acetylesterase [Phycisphaerae bacterium]|jgi:lysophospholipase L1-like esterase|nr:rhamnogalacturonan acetylesterase [Phycisphaerae bacterium]
MKIALALGTIIASLTACAWASLPASAPAASASAPAAKPVVYPTVDGRKPVIYLIGDSTVKNGRDDGATGGQWGWGHILHYYFDETKVTVVNDAVGGTSSRSFYQTASMWPRTLAKLQQGDYVFMQFGHNDDTRPPESDTLRYRSTIKSNGEETVQGPKDANTMETIHSFGWYERQMIGQAREKKAIPVVCSLIPRNSWGAGGKANRADTGYAKFAHEAADQAGAFFLPLNKLIADKYDQLGREKVTADLFPQGESTHTNWAGARLNAECVAEGIKGLEGCPLKELLKEKPVVPEKADK